MMIEEKLSKMMKDKPQGLEQLNERLQFFQDQLKESFDQIEQIKDQNKDLNAKQL